MEMKIKRIRTGLKITGNKEELLDAMLLASSMEIRNYKQRGELIIASSGRRLESLEKFEKKLKKAHRVQ